MVVYICPKCKKKEELERELIFHCGDCSRLMINERILDIGGKNISKISRYDKIKGKTNIAKAMIKSFGNIHRHRWTSQYLNVTKKLVKITPEMLKRFEEGE